ncbi:hypothetical protein BH18ACT15_BH18ACT15_04190 [soil metagenome]
MTGPNVFLLVVDSLRADAVFQDRISTPNLDRRVTEGADFRQCIATSTTTTPSFASLLTGCYPPKHGIRGLRGYRLSPVLATLPEVFGTGGYNTYAEVAGSLIPATGVLRGFATVNHRRGILPFFSWRDALLERRREWTAPWLALLHVWEVHWPYRSPPGYEHRFDKAGYEDALRATDDALGPILDTLGDDTLVVVTGDHGERYPTTAWGVKLAHTARRLRRRFKPGRWFPALDQKLVSVALHHGFALDEQLIRVPLVINGPSVDPMTIDDQVRHVDLLPTLVDLCGLELPSGVDGRSLRPLLEGGSLPEEPAYMEAVGVSLEGRHIIGARTQEWKLLRTAGRGLKLYALGEGPSDEKRNLYTGHPEVTRFLEGYIKRVAESALGAEGMTPAEEALVEEHLRDLGYLE